MDKPNVVSAVLKVVIAGEFYDEYATSETLRYAVEQDLEDAGFDVCDVSVMEYPGWISVKDVLPQEPLNRPHIVRQWYLVALESGCVMSLSYDFELEKWAETGSPVTHWQELPEAPEVKHETD